MAFQPPAAGAGQRGFTLLEMLVVLVLIGIILTFVTLSTGGSSAQDRMREEALRLDRLMGMLREEAILQTQELALEKTETGYRFARLVTVEPTKSDASGAADTLQDAGANAQQTPQWKWEPIVDDALFRERELDADIELRLTLEGVSPRRESGEARAQRIYFSPSGEITPFELELSDRNGTAVMRLKGQATGEISHGQELAAGG